jgi:putative ABC transport system permease protein
VNAGFETRGLVAARVALPPRAPGVDAAAEARQKFERIVEELRTNPAVRSAAVTSQAPMGPGGNSNGLLREGLAMEPKNLLEARLRVVSPGYFSTMGIRLVAGRDFTVDDTREASLVMVVSEELARRAWGNENPIGKRLICCEGEPDDPRFKTVVGVVADTKWRGLTQEAIPEFYLPLRQIPAEAWDWTRRTMTIVARGKLQLQPQSTAEGAEDAEVAQSVTAAIRSAVRTVEPGVPVFSITTLEEARRRSTATTQFHTRLLVYLGAVGLLLAAAGIYSVIAYFVSLRTREIGIRMALGATARDVLRLMTWQGVRPVLIGVAIGAVGAFWATRLLRGSLYGVSATDPITFAAVSFLMVAVSLVATLIPARRATRVDPTKALST